MDDASTYAVELEAEPPGQQGKKLPSIAEHYEPDEDADLGEGSRPQRRQRRGGQGSERGWTGDLVPGLSNFALIMIVLGVGWACGGGLTFLFPPAGLLLIGAGMLVSLVSGIWMLKIAFDDGFGTGMLYLLFWPYALMFILSNLDRTGVPFLINLVGGAYVLSGFVGMAIRGG